MESPPYLFDQYAKGYGLSKQMAKRGLLLKGYAEEGRTLTDCKVALGISKASVQRLCRKLLIDLADYRPYEALERKGEPRPAPTPRADKPVAGLPLFGA